jgi:hypothetical protein
VAGVDDLAWNANFILLYSLMELFHLCCEPGESLGLCPQDVKLAEAQVSKTYENQMVLVLFFGFL